MIPKICLNSRAPNIDLTGTEIVFKYLQKHVLIFEHSLPICSMFDSEFVTNALYNTFNLTFFFFFFQ